MTTVEETPNVSVVVNETEPETETSTDAVVEQVTASPTVEDRNVAVPLSLVVRTTNLIDNLAKRGSFGAGEMAEVGVLYNNLVLVINNVVNQIKAEQALPAESTETTTE